MKSASSPAFVIVILTLCDFTMGHWSCSKRCDGLPKERLNPADLLRITSFTMTHSISPIFNCTKVIYVKPISPNIDYSIIVPQGNSASYYDVNVVNCGKTILATECITGLNSTWHLYKVRLESDTDGYLCPYICSSDGLSLQQFNCFSAGNSVNPAINKAISYLKSNIPGADAIFDAKSNCPAPKCVFF